MHNKQSLTISIAGKSNVGKKSIRDRYLSNKNKDKLPINYAMVEFQMNDVTYRKSLGLLTCDIVDNGKYKFFDVIDAFVLVYDVTNSKSVDIMFNFYKKIIDHHYNNNKHKETTTTIYNSSTTTILTPIAIIGNKSDLIDFENHQESSEIIARVDQWCGENGIKHKISMNTDHSYQETNNINTIFQLLLNDMMSRYTSTNTNILSCEEQQSTPCCTITDNKECGSSSSSSLSNEECKNKCTQNETNKEQSCIIM
ncbi:hypothetical protein PPL_08126 [Heterostelium album PN500]|uniref:Uncharacterized protein n=1 Tax=Heterostelium pallidum (strain ATCC 26659 / Pp 5 / PN500) TaxID=670386 RepID=D3BIP3_HETP5|nr:hypothetical protein PPL_08126 [Heterostelium album PN500]EFA78667.1 hypothetical protein PPL_08126 [Heterostelium album PN500]|eukprot:XP_020430791.1 hypothetical protein PPL_08126 [Heterostelium album PN500]